MGKAQEKTTVSCTLYPTRARLGKQILFEDGPLKSLYRRNVYVHHPVRVFPLTDNFSVVNPSVRMTWIMNNWEKEWSDNAIKIIQDLVSVIFDFMRYFIIDTCFLDGGIPGTRQAHRHVRRRA